MNPELVGRYLRPMDAIHAVTYFAPEMSEHLVAAGLERGRMEYFAARSAAMGAVSAKVVAATFYNFNHEAIANFIPRAWELCPPGKVVEARYVAADAIMRRLLGDTVNSPAVAELAELLEIAARAASPDGRALYAGHADTEWPESAHMRMWHALTLLREHRGDGHIMALQVVGLSGLEALISYVATGHSFTPKFARTRRGWSQEQWDAAVAGLQDREILDAQGKLTELGTETRTAIEDLTDDLGYAPWMELGDQGFNRVIDLAEGIHARVIAAEVLPRSAFSPDWAFGTWPDPAS